MCVACGSITGIPKSARWRSGSRTATASICGHIYWLRKPLSGGRPKRDQHNPDARLRDRPLCGLRILSGFRRTGDGAWSAGQIYNPSDGRTFSSTMTLENDGGLRISGYLGIVAARQDRRMGASAGKAGPLRLKHSRQAEARIG